jgi:flagellar biosynthesis protein FlhG
MGDEAPINVIAISSGKGGVGKTSVAVNLAVALAEAGQAVLLFDADLGLANVDVALGLKPERDISAVLAGHCSLADVIVPGPAGTRIVPAASGVAQMASLNAVEQAGLVNAFSDLSGPLDTLLVDTGAGIDSAVLTFASACPEIIVVICDEPTSLTDAYALIKVLSRDHGVKRFQVLANMVDNELQGRRLFEKLCTVADRYLDVHLGYLGQVPRDDYLRRAVRQQQPVMTAYPRAPSSVAFRRAAERVRSSLRATAVSGGLGFFLERLIAEGADHG